MSSLKLSLMLIVTIASVFASLPCGAQAQSRSRELSFWTVGSEGVARRFGTDLYETLRRDKLAVDQILLVIAEEPRAEDQISRLTSLQEGRLRDLLTRLDALHVIRKDAKGRWVTTVPVVTDVETTRIRKHLIPVARGVARYIQGELPRLTARYDQVKARRDPSWNDLAHLLIDKFVIDGTFHSAIGRVERERGAQQYYSEDQRIIPAFFLERGEHFSTFGSNWYPFTQGAAQREVYVLHGSLFRRNDIRMNAYRGDSAFSTVLFSLAPAGGIEALSKEQEDILRDLGWIGGSRLLVPVVQASTIKSLWPTLEEIGAGAAEIVFDNYSIILDAFTGSSYSRFLDAGGDFLQVCYHALFGIALEQLAEVGAVPPFPNPVPEHFGVYIVMGKLF